MNLYFVRHGETVANGSHILAGHLDAELDAKGKKQAKQAAKDIMKKGIKFDLILSSPLKRATETAAIIASEIGYDHEKIDIVYELIERDFGDYSGRRAPRGNLFTTFSKRKSDRSVESLDHLMERAKRVLDKIESDYSEYPNILVVSHSVFGEALIAAIRNYDFKHMKAMHKPRNGKVMKLKEA